MGVKVMRLDQDAKIVTLQLLLRQKKKKLGLKLKQKVSIMSHKNEKERVRKQAQKSIYQYFSGFLNSSSLAFDF